MPKVKVFIEFEAEDDLTIDEVDDRFRDCAYLMSDDSQNKREITIIHTLNMKPLGEPIPHPVEELRHRLRW